MAEEVVVKSMPLDDLADVVRKKFDTARDYRQETELVWSDAYDAYRATYPEEIQSSNELAESRGIFINLTRRQVQAASIRIISMLLDDGRIPFTVKPSRRPRFVPPEIQDMPDMRDQLFTRAVNMEDRIRDILDRTGYQDTLQDVVVEMCLFGTGITKAVTLKQRNFPVYKSVRTDEVMYDIESEIETETVPTASFVSCWNLFPAPEAKSFEDAEFVVQRSFMSSIELRDLGQRDQGFFADRIEEAIKQQSGKVSGEDNSEHPKRVEETGAYDRQKDFEVLEFWGRLDSEDIGEYLDLGPGEMSGMLDVVITVVGDKVIRIAENPFDGQMPYYACHWQRSPESLWGDGVWYSIRDIQSVINFSYAMMIEGKHLASIPMSVVDPGAFEAGEDTERVYPGRQFRTKPGVDVNTAFKPIVIPDVTNGLINLVQLLEQQSNLDTGLPPIGLGQDAPYQTKTATGMSLLNTNSNRLTASVVRSVSGMITNTVQAIYRWLMVDDEDPAIKGDFEGQCYGYQRFISDEIHNVQLLNFLQVAGQSPQLQGAFNFSELAKPLARAFHLDPNNLVKSEEELAMQSQSAQQAQVQQAQQAVQLEVQKEQGIAQIEIEKEKQLALLKEKASLGEDAREAEIKERSELIKQGNILRPSKIMSMSALLAEEEKAQFQQQQQMMQQQQAEAQQAQLQQLQMQEQMSQREAGAIREVADQMTKRTEQKQGKVDLVA